jgi:aspartate aminotransferase-like enzyme
MPSTPKYRLLTPGPVAVPERILRAMSGTLLHHRSPEFIPIFNEVRAGLRKVFETQRDVVILASSGTGAMEMAVANLTKRGDLAIVVRGGKFGERWAELCESYGVRTVCIDVEWGRAVEPDAVRAAFRSHPDARYLFVQASETSTGVYHPIEALAAITRESPDRLIVVDGISGVGVHKLPMDAWGIDCMVSGSQKSWLLPPGLAFIALSERAEAALERCDQPRYYFDLRKEIEGQAGASPAYTPAVSLIMGLQEALRLIHEEGLESVLARHESLARLVRGAAEALGLGLLAADSPSFACTAIRLPEGVDGKKLEKTIRDRYGITMAGGQDKLSGKILRIGHMGDVDGFDMLTAIAALEMALLDLGHPVNLGAGTRMVLELMRTARTAR